jgi:uncharacterized protein involved in outer membrane biogenesis
VRKILIGIVVLLVVLVAAAFFGPRFIPADSLKAEIAEQVRAATGRDLIIDGDLSFTLLPAPGVTASGVRVSNIEGAQAANMVQLKSAQVAVALGPLITGTVEIERVVLVEPVFELEQLADGANNWTISPPERAAEPGTGGAAEPGSSAGSIQLNDLVVRDGTIVFRSPDITERIEGINASFGAASLLGPFRAEGDLVVRGMAARLNAAIGELKFDQAIPVSVATGIGDSELSFSGLLSGFPNELRVAGEIEGKAENFASLIAAVSGGALPGALAASPLAIKGDLEADSNAIALNNISIGLGDINAAGAATAALGETPAIDLILNVGQFDLDRALADFRAGSRKANGLPARTGSTPAGDRKAGQPGGGQAARASAAFALPASLNATIETRIEALIYRGGVIRQAALNAQLADGELTISQLTAQLPGSADVSLFGFVTARDGVPAFGGQGEANADDLRGLLTWLGVDVSTVPLDRLRKLALTAKLDGVLEQFNVTDIDLGVDGSRVRGGVAVALRERLGLGIGLSLDKLNIDAYLPATSDAPAPAGAATAPQSGAQPRSGRVAAPAGRSGLAFLDSFDSVLQFKAGTLTYRGKSIQGLNIDGTLAAGTLELRDASVKSLAGAQAKALGRIEGIATAAPTADLNIDVEAKESDRLLEMLGAAPAFTVGPGRLRGSVKGNVDALDIDLTLAALDAELATKGNLSPLKSDPEFDLSLDLKHGDAKAFLARMSSNGTAANAGQSPGALRVAGAATGSLAKSSFSAGITVGAGSFAVKGQISNAGTEQMSGGIALSGQHPSLANAVRIFAPDYRPALAEPGPLKFSTDLAFDSTTLRIDNMSGNAGPVAFESNASVALDRARPRIAGELMTSEIIVDWFLPVQKRAAPSAGAASAPAGAARTPARAPAGSARWSNERLDFSPLRKLDGEIAFTAPALTYTDLKVDQPKVSVQLTDGVLQLSELSGRAYGGEFNMTGQVADGEVPSLRYALSIDGADAAQFTGAAGQQGGRGVMSVLDLLFPVSSVRLASGTLDAKIDVASRGRSERELIGGLSGNGSVNFTNAVAEGVDVCRISNQLDNLDGLEGFLGLVISAQGGSTRIANYAGQFDISNGVATLPRQRMTADCATVDFAGSVDLPRWLIDLQAKALFPQHPEFPGVIVEQKGQLDTPNTRLVNSNQVQQYIIARSAGSILRKLVPETEQQPAPAQPGSTQSQPAPAPEPVEQFRNLLDDLIKGR